MSNPPQTIVEIMVVSGTNVVSHALTRRQSQVVLSRSHKELMAEFKAETTPAIIKLLEDSRIAFDTIAARAAGKGEAA
jgi:predicted mannosyl-3-phosphoglycerate phosphatase (HAD superfamily)